MPNKTGSLNDRVILIGERRWVIASALADAFKAKGAQVLMVANCHSDLADIPTLSAAVLDSDSHDLRQRFEARGIPVVLYTACVQIDGESISGPIIQKPAQQAEVVARLEQLLI